MEIESSKRKHRAQPIDSASKNYETIVIFRLFEAYVLQPMLVTSSY